MKLKKIIPVITLFILLLCCGISANAATTINVSSVDELQSAHPYSNNMNTTWVYTHTNPVEGLEITFSSDTETENGLDYIYIYDGQDTQIGVYTGTQLKGQTVEVTGNVIKIKLTSDSSTTKNGFTVSNISEIPATIVTSGTCGTNLNYVLYSEGTLKISGTGKMTAFSGLSSVPWYSNRSSIKRVIIDSGVTNIANYSFSNHSNLESISIPNTVTEIGFESFLSCKSLTEIFIPSSVTKIGESFNYCNSLQNFYVDENNQYYSSKHGVLFDKNKTVLIKYPAGKQYTIYSVPSTVTTIKTSAFLKCTNLATVSMFDGIETIGALSFTECSNLIDVYIPKTVKTIGNSAFSYTTSDNLHIFYAGTESEWNKINIGTSGNSTLTAATKTYNNTQFTGICGNYGGNAYWVLDSLGHLNIYGEGDICSGNWDSSKVTSITLSEDVSGIADNTFADCENVRFVYFDGSKYTWNKMNIGQNNECLTNSILIIGSVVDSGTCGSGVYWKVYGGGTLYIYGYGNMNDYTSSSVPWKKYQYSGLYNGDYISNVIIDEGVTNIGNYAFYGFGISNIHILSNVTKIGASAFASSSLEEIIIPQSVENIDKSAFQSCYSLSKVEMGNGVKNIGESAFQSCINLENITLSNQLNSIGSNAFYNCSKMKNIILPDTLTTINDEAFMHCYALTEITVPKSVNSCGAYIFEYCNGLKTATINSSAISKGMFRFCDALETVTISSNVQSIGDWPFQSDISLKAFVVDKDNQYFCDIDGVLYTKDMTTLIQYNLGNTRTEYAIPNGVTTLKPYSFSNASNIEKLYLPASVENVDYFHSCSKLSEFVVDNASETFSSLSGVLFSKDMSILKRYPPAKTNTIYAIPNTVATISSGFYENNILTKIIMPSTVTSVGSNCFNDRITDVYYAGNEEQWNNISFSYGNSSLTTPTATIHYNGETDHTHEYTLTEQGWLWNDDNTSATVNIYCAVCDDNRIVNAEITETGNNATCTEDGSKTYKATATYNNQNFENSVVKDLTATGHTEVIDEAVAPTCTATGVTEGKHCSVCDEVLVAQTEVAATGHTEVIDEAVAPTCTKTGLTEGSHCSVCDEVLVAQKVVRPTGHTKVAAPAVEPTCTETGLTEGEICSVCETVFVAQNIVDALGHTEVIDKAIDATCTETGLTEGKHCSVCEEILVEQTIVSAKGHTEVIDNAVEPTCTATGLTEGKHCSVCNEVLVEQSEIEATGHTEVADEAVAPTCTKEGLTAGSHCSVCNQVIVEQETIASLGHTEVVDKGKAPICTETGLTDGKHCSVCKEVLVNQEVIEANGHTIETDAAIPPTCSADGMTEGHWCSVCNETLDGYDTIPATGHTEVIDEAVAATCTTSGLTAGKHCSTCRLIMVKQTVVNALGHSEVIDNAIPATCTSSGLTEGSHCSRCDKVFVKQEVIPALGHDFNEDETCKNGCGVEYTETQFEVSACTIKDSKTCTYSLTLISSNTPKGELLVAVYDEDNRLIGLITRSIEVVEQDADRNELELSGDVAISGTPHTYKIMFWNSLDKLTPLCDVAFGNVK